MRGLVLVLWCLALPLCAHKLSVFVKESGDMVEIRAYFSKSAPCKGCEVQVQDALGKPLIKIHTNDEGKVWLELPKEAARLVVEGGMGHQQEVALEGLLPQKEEPASFTFLVSLLGIGVFFGLLWYVKRPK